MTIRTAPPRRTSSKRTTSKPTPPDTSNTPATPATPTSSTTEETVDEKLVTEAARWIKKKVGETVHRGQVDIGEYVFEKFYDGDIEQVRSNSPRKKASLRALADRCDTPELPIAKGALFSAVNVAVMARSLPEDAVAFRQLPPSHQSALLPLKDPARVERLAQRALTKDLAVRALRVQVRDELAKKPPADPPRGRPKSPFVLKALRGVLRELTADGGRVAFTKAQVDELSDEGAAEARKMAEAVMAGMEKLLERLGERG